MTFNKMIEETEIQETLEIEDKVMMNLEGPMRETLMFLEEEEVEEQEEVDLDKMTLEEEKMTSISNNKEGMKQMIEVEE